jgi:transcriptional regulator with XRE-family HTH domain
MRVSGPRRGGNIEVGREIRRIREGKSWGQAKLAAAADMGVPGISQIEAGARNLSAVTLSKIVQALGVGVADLFPKVPSPQPSLPLDGEYQEGARAAS